MTSDSQSTGYLTGQLLVAMPQMQDPRFIRSVIYICAHTADGAMGLVINKLLENVSFPDLLEQLNIEPPGGAQSIEVHFGGPVEPGRALVLHFVDYCQDATLVINRSIALTATIDILRDIAGGRGPSRSLLALGYAGWGPGQLDDEIQANGWLSVPADDTIVFGNDLAGKWQSAVAKLGIDANFLSSESGHA